MQFYLCLFFAPWACTSVGSKLILSRHCQTPVALEAMQVCICICVWFVVLCVCVLLQWCTPCSDLLSACAPWCAQKLLSLVGVSCSTQAPRRQAVHAGSWARLATSCVCVLTLGSARVPRQMQKQRNSMHSSTKCTHFQKVFATSFLLRFTSNKLQTVPNTNAFDPSICAPKSVIRIAHKTQQKSKIHHCQNVHFRPFSARFSRFLARSVVCTLGQSLWHICSKIGWPGAREMAIKNHQQIARPLGSNGEMKWIFSNMLNMSDSSCKEFSSFK